MRLFTKELNVKQTEARVAFYKEGNQRLKNPRRISFTKDVRLGIEYDSSIYRHGIRFRMEIKTNEKDHEDHYEIVIKIPKR